MTDYTYLFGSLETGLPIAELPLTGTYCDLELNVGGRFDGTTHLDSEGIPNDIVLAATVPGRTWVVVIRENKPVWTGTVWSRVYQSQAKSLQLYGQSFEYLPTHWKVETDFERLATEQVDIFLDLWEAMQAPPGRNFNINPPMSPPVTGVTRDVTVLESENKLYADIISSFADTETGFDWTIDVAQEGPFFTRKLRIATALGSDDPSRLTFEYPGSILNYYATESMSEAATHIYVLGEDTEEATVIGISEDAAGQVASGLPRWDLVMSRKDINNQGIIDDFAAQQAINRRPPRMVIKPTLKAEVAPEFGSFGLGDACRFAIKDARFPLGFQTDARIVKWTLNPSSSDNVEEYRVILAGDDVE